MGQYLLFNERKEIKKRGHAILRSHYIFLVFLALLLVLYGGEFKYSKGQWSYSFFSVNYSLPSLEVEREVEEEDEKGKKEESEWEVELERGSNDSSPWYLLPDFLTKKAEKAGILGKSQGLLAQIVNGRESHRLLWTLAEAVRTISRGNIEASAISVVIATIWYVLIFTFFINVYSAAIRRAFLEARVYASVPLMNILYFTTLRQWLRTSRTMLVKYILNALWFLTVIGGFIKYFSYWAVPYIMAENPTLTSKEAITLSRKMMNGHKLDLFMIHVTFLGWYLLGIVTFGISDMAYGVAYRLSCYAEIYARIREKALETGIEGSDLLNDSCLFEQADRITLYETYFHVIDEISLIHENRIALTGFRKTVVDWFGIWLGGINQKRDYDEQEGRKHAISRNKAEMSGEIYPRLLCPFFSAMKKEKPKSVSYLKSYTLWDLFMIFISISFLGWSWEVALHLIQTGTLANRGTFHGPWLPIYGVGAIIVLVFCNRFRKNPVLEGLIATLLCGTLEYFSALFLETKYHQSWWSYDGYFLNLHGRICAEGLLLFGIGCCAIVYLLAPLLEYLFSRLRKNVLIAVCLVLLVAYGADAAYSIKHPNTNTGENTVSAPPQK